MLNKSRRNIFIAIKFKIKYIGQGFRNVDIFPSEQKVDEIALESPNIILFVTLEIKDNNYVYIELYAANCAP